MNLALSVEEMAAGNFLKNFASDDKDEVGQLSNSIEELKIKLKTGVAIDASKNKEIDKIKTDFVTIASHQLRTPLSIIKWYTDFLITGDAGAITKDQKHYLEEIYFSNERLIELVNALLDVSRIDLGTFSIDPELTDIVDIANEAIHKFAKTIEDKKIKVEVDFDKFQKINLDPRLIKMVFENLISNSVKYTAETGKINVVIKKTEKNIFIKISDMGVGIPKDQQPKIFLKMFRADNARKIDAGGTGLGLFIVKAIIEKSGGKIWFESPSLDLLLEKERKSNKIDQTKMGTTFFITIPLTGMIKKKGEKQLM
ncbi:HAMP domain-containing histidine kinase [Candidatus Parcubacteria bacterium]|nr:HAMP domain-containing histidine kinase [Candidatus Parcubacteria bacterium]